MEEQQINKAIYHKIECLLFVAGDPVAITELARVLERNTPMDAVNALVGTANGRGGRDNITVIVAAIEPEDLP